MKKTRSIFWQMIHNLVCHPLMALTWYSNWSVRLHDTTATLAFGDSDSTLQD